MEIDIFDRLPTPYGLVRAGVAPDHYKIKSVTRVYDKIAANPNVRFYGNVEYGRDLCLHRCGSLQRTLPFGTPKDCRAEAIELIRTCGQDGGLVLGASNTVGFDVPTENIAAWYEAVRDYRQ